MAGSFPSRLCRLIIETASGSHAVVRYRDYDVVYLIEHVVRAKHLLQPLDVDHHLALSIADGVAVVVGLSGLSASAQGSTTGSAAR